jgi:Asp-tRNA(Asn)/Glu-tRNA(Gln) amidotransferase A subunit family amidase
MPPGVSRLYSAPSGAYPIHSAAPVIDPGTSSQSIAEIVVATTSGQISCREWAQSRLDRISRLEPEIGAWAHLDPELVLDRAGRLDGSSAHGPLHGITVGVKDIIDTHDLPTEFGSEIHHGNRPPRDAACVALTRRAGGIIVGKSVTTEFANVTPGKTRNPFDPERSPGGSSSGSAAAVAAGMVDIAIGTQTTGSTTRPASFCGVVGYRPSFGDLSTSGVMQVSGSVDTIGILGRCVADVAVYRDVLLGVAPRSLPAVSPPKIGFARTSRWRDIHQTTRSLLENLADDMVSDSATVEEVLWPSSLDELDEAHRWITGFEMTRNLSWEIDNHWDALSEGLREGRLRDGARCSEDLYLDMRARAADARLELDGLFADSDVILAPAAVGEATPLDDPVPHPWIYRPWTMLHLPVVTLPILKGPNGLPIGVQLIGRHGEDRFLLAVANWLEKAFGYPSSYVTG